MKSYQALGALLLYPGADVLAALDDIRSVLEHEDVVPRSALPGVRDCIAGLATADPWTACEAYVATFDRGRATALNLFEHVHGESRDRGQALVDLGAMYADAGLNFDARELPDYLPAYLEFVATQPADVARDMVAEIGHILHKLGEALAERGSPYAYVIDALLATIGERLDVKPASTHAVSSGARVFEEVDAEWLDPPVTFGGCASSAPVDAQRVDFVRRVRPEQPTSGNTP